MAACAFSLAASTFSLAASASFLPASAISSNFSLVASISSWRISTVSSCDAICLAAWSTAGTTSPMGSSWSTSSRSNALPARAGRGSELCERRRA